MARDKAYRKAEAKIEEARCSGATELDLSCTYKAKNSQKLTDLPESLGQHSQLQALNPVGNSV